MNDRETIWLVEISLILSPPISLVISLSLSMILQSNIM